MTPNQHRRMLRLLHATAAFAVACSVAVHAQRFQWSSGGAPCSEAGRAGVTQLAGGGYVYAGESYSLLASCGASHIYVVVSDAAANLVWSNVYSIGTSDSALDVIECCNGDLAICGVTTNATGCNTGRDAFVLRLDANGGVIAVRTFGTNCSDEEAWNLIEAQTGNGTTSFPGDLIVAGSTTFNGGILVNPLRSGARDGYIFRTDANLNLRWDQHYGGPTSYDDYLYGVYESRVGVATGTAGDIVATGGTDTPFPGNYDIWGIRVNGDNGTIGAAPQNSATYGGPDFEEGRAIVELRFATNPGDLVITGISFSAPAPSTSSDIALVRTGPNPCTINARTLAGEFGALPDGGMDLKEDAFPTVATGGLIVTGFIGFGPAVFAPPNVFLSRFDAATLAPLGAAMLYGGTGTDVGWSVNNCLRDGFCTSESEGYVVGGYTESPGLIPGGDVRQMYVMKTDLNLSSSCNEQAFTLPWQGAPTAIACNPVAYLPIGVTCVPATITTNVTWFTQLCYIYP